MPADISATCEVEPKEMLAAINSFIDLAYSIFTLLGGGLVVVTGTLHIWVGIKAKG